MPEMKKGRIAALLTKKTEERWQKKREKRRHSQKRTISVHQALHFCTMLNRASTTACL
jgi:hypothetical protein